MYIENIALKKSISSWLFFMFWIISVMIIVGGLTRLTDSGLSITRWELFAGFLPPLSENAWEKYFDLYKEIPEFRLQNYDMNMNEFKVIFGRLIGISFLIPLIYFTYRTSFKKMFNLYLIFFLICFQGFIGWYMVSSGLVDRIDVSHYRLAVHLMRVAGKLAGDEIGPGMVADDVPPYLSRALITGPVLLHLPEVEDPSSS